MSTETVVGIASIAAIVVGPIIALQLQKHLDTRREARNRKLTVFKTLMTYRATTLSPYFVQALNLIDVEFDAKSEKPVRDAWKVLLDHFADLGRLAESNTTFPSNTADKSATLTTNLLMAMGKSLGYDFDEVQIKKGAYYPMGLGNVEQEQHTLRHELLDVLEGRRRIPVGIFEDRFPEIILPHPGTTAETVTAPEAGPLPERSLKKLTG
ncbi:MAG TPA: DUF6680 family protein [Terriglobia bacterium]|nr:DUF6680 family protein [Terriglobia bacterium]